MNLLVHKIASWFLKRRIEQVERFTRNPLETQFNVLIGLLEKAKQTEWGRKYDYASIQSIETFQERVPISSYEDLHPWIDRTFKGEANILWPGKTEFFSKSSGTTNDKSKYIPVTSDSLDLNHFKAAQDFVSIYLHNKPASKLFAGKNLSIGGSHEINQANANSRVGDLSALLIENLPTFFEIRRSPSKQVALMDNWEAKIEAMADEVMHDDISAIGGVPTWTLVLIDRIFEKKGIADKNLLEIWPNLELYIHGGVNFDPYRENFKKLIPSDQMSYLDCYNASEGFFAGQDRLDATDMLLMLDYGVFFEFVLPKDLHLDHPPALSLEQVEPNVNYAMIISTNGGLWRYVIGDTITFTSVNPYRIRITGRTKHFINAFGEELIVDNADNALQVACQETRAQIEDYTAAPIYFSGDKSQGGHEWIIEFRQAPENIDIFTQLLDENLKVLNSDYEAKRSFDIALRSPKLHEVPVGTFQKWLKSRNQLGGQHKVPRLSNDRKYVDEILLMLNDNHAQ